MDDSTPLADQVGLVTGGGTGIGLAVARSLVEAGMRVALLGRRADVLDEAASALGPLAFAVPCDITSLEETAAALSRVRSEYGPTDLLVHSAAAIEPEAVPLWEVDPAVTWSVVETCLRGPLLLDAIVLGDMVARGRGRVVTIASEARAAALSGTYTGYAVGKRAATLLTQTLAGSLAGTGVVALDVLPGLVRTELTDSMSVWRENPPERWDDPAWTAATVLNVALGRHDDAAGAMLDAVALHGS